MERENIITFLRTECGLPGRKSRQLAAHTMAHLSHLSTPFSEESDMDENEAMFSEEWVSSLSPSQRQKLVGILRQCCVREGGDEDDESNGCNENEWRTPVFVAMDFEATCWSSSRRGEQRPPNSHQEIIDFPAVALDADGHVLGTFHEFVKPQEAISSFCRDLTGLDNAKVFSPNTRTLEVVLAAFTAWLDRLLGTPPTRKLPPTPDYGRVVLISCGLWDGQQLHEECTRKGIRLPAFFEATHWRDVKKYVERFYSLAKPPSSLVEVVAETGGEWKGRHHSGKDDTANLAGAVGRMLANGCFFDHPLAIPEKGPAAQRQC